MYTVLMLVNFRDTNGLTAGTGTQKADSFYSA
jgi:hypothetical protein